MNRHEYCKLVLYNGPVMKAIATENLVIGTLAGIGLVVLILLFAYVVKRIMRDE